MRASKGGQHKPVHFHLIHAVSPAGQDTRHTLANVISMEFGIVNSPAGANDSAKVVKHRRHTHHIQYVEEMISNSYTMGCLPVRGDNPRALASGLSYVHEDKHGITILYHLHQCRPTTS